MLYLVYPIPHARITGRFGEIGGPYGDQPHRGLDFSAVIGTPVRAAHDGIVQNAEGEREGLCVWLREGIVATLYAHLSQQSCLPGQRVKAGELIGLSGDSGLSTGPHLHLGLRVEAVYEDPEPWLRLIPSDETETYPTVLAAKVRWWLEESLRFDEIGQDDWAAVLRRSLVTLAYRLENACREMMAHAG